MAEKILTGADNDLCTKHNNEANDGNYRNGDNKLEHEDNDDESDDCNDNDDVPPPPSTEPNLMVKMKFLPYMVRTFFCRNGLNSTLYRNCTASYDAF